MKKYKNLVVLNVQEDEDGYSLFAGYEYFLKQLKKFRDKPVSRHRLALLPLYTHKKS